MPVSNPSQSFAEFSSNSDQEFDVIVIGSGIGGLVTATQLAAKGANV
ncbi:FAD-binding protein, partial [Planktothrix sp.]